MLLLALVLIATWYGGVWWSAWVHTRDTLRPKLLQTHPPLALSELSARQREILLRVVDPGFSLHHGIDWHTPGAGATTITQALVKLLYFQPYVRGVSKIRQNLIARWVVDPWMSKDEQLLLFINLADLGRGAKGFAAGAELHFRKSFGALDETEYIGLVALLAAPAVFDPFNHPDRHAERVVRIQRLLEGRYLPQGLLDVYYGPLAPDVQRELPSRGYFGLVYGD